MKILQVCPKFLPEAASGSTRVAYVISKELARRGYDVTALASDARDAHAKIKSGFEETNSIRIYRFSSVGFTITGRNKLFVTPEMIHALKKEIMHFDVIHLHEYISFQNIVVHHYAQKHDIPYVLHAHGSLLRIGAKRKLKWIYDVLFGYRLLRDASKVIALSSMEAEQYKSVGIPDEKIAVIPNGIDLSNCSDLPPTGRFRRRYGIEKEKKVILFLGRINRLKGIDFLINAFSYLIKNMEYDALLVVAGPDDGYLDKTKKLVKQNKIEGKILFTGPLFGMRKVEAYVDASLVASLDSLKEVVFLLVPLEAAACGTPVIVTKSNYIATLIKGRKFGSAVEYGNVTDLATTFKEMLSNEDALKQMGLNGQIFVSENFDWKRIVSKIEKVYEDVVRKKQ